MAKPSTEAADQADHIAALRQRVEFLTGRNHELEETLAQAQAELARRDEEMGKLVDEATRDREARLLALDDEVRSLNRTIRMMQATRVWQLGERYWHLRDTVRQRLRRV